MAKERQHLKTPALLEREVVVNQEIIDLLAGIHHANTNRPTPNPTLAKLQSILDEKYKGQASK